MQVSASGKGEPSVCRAEPHGVGEREAVCQRADAAPALLGMRTRGAPLQAGLQSRAGGRDVLSVTGGALLGLLCSAARHAHMRPCAPRLLSQRRYICAQLSLWA